MTPPHLFRFTEVIPWVLKINLSKGPNHRHKPSLKVLTALSESSKSKIDFEKEDEDYNAATAILMRRKCCQTF